MAIIYISRVARNLVTGNLEQLFCVPSGKKESEGTWKTKKTVYDDLQTNSYYTVIWDYALGKWKKGEKVQRLGFSDIKTHNDGKPNNNLDNLPNVWQIIEFPVQVPPFRFIR